MPTSPFPDAWNPTVAFLSGVTADATIAAISYSSWETAGNTASRQPTAATCPM